MTESFALKGAARYLRENHDGNEIDDVLLICHNLADSLSKEKGYLHPRALAAASSHIYLTGQGVSVTLEKVSATFKISSATLREYLKTSPGTSAEDACEKMLEKNLYGYSLREALKARDLLLPSIKQKKNTVNSAALAAASVYVSLYKGGQEVSLSDIARDYSISASTLRDYVSCYEKGVDPKERAMKLLLSHAPNIDERQALRILESAAENTGINTARILAAITFYLYTVDKQEYATVERVARDFNVSIPALRSYLEPYMPSIAGTYLLFKKGGGSARVSLSQLNDSETALLKSAYGKFGTNIFETSELFLLGNAPRGRWQLLLRKLGKLGLIDIYKRPLDPRQYCSISQSVVDVLSTAERLEKWVG